MNPELQRNLWLEFTPRRLVLMMLVLGVVFGVTALATPSDERMEVLGGLSHGLFGLLVMLWGARNAANALAGEVRERTWDMQKLSAIDPWTMTWGKLVGATAYPWFGGLLALIPFAVTAWREPAESQGPAFLLLTVALGVGAQALALLVCLTAARRRPQTGRFDVLIYAIGAYVLASGLMTSVSTARLIDYEGDTPAGDVIWMGLSFPFGPFAAVSALVWAGFAIFGCWRLMRRELMMPHDISGPLIFLVFASAYAAGFVAPASNEPMIRHTANLLLSAALASGAFTAACTLGEPKDPVLWRWMAARWRAGDRKGALARAPGFAVGYVVTFALGLAAALCSVLGGSIITHADSANPIWPVIIAALGFLARDILIFVFFHAAPRQRRGDFAAIVLLALLYGAGGVLTSLAPFEGLRAIFLPSEAAGNGLMALAPWIQVGLMAVLVRGRLRAGAARMAPA